MGTVDEGESFFRRFWPEARAVSDTKKQLYRAFGLESGSVSQFAGPKVWGRGLKAVLAGNTGGVPVGDVRQMPGQFLVHNDEIVWEHRAKTSADHPDFASLSRVS